MEGSKNKRQKSGSSLPWEPGAEPGCRTRAQNQGSEPGFRTRIQSKDADVLCMSRLLLAADRFNLAYSPRFAFSVLFSVVIKPSARGSFWTRLQRRHAGLGCRARMHIESGAGKARLRFADGRFTLLLVHRVCIRSSDRELCQSVRNRSCLTELGCRTRMPSKDTCTALVA